MEIKSKEIKIVPIDSIHPWEKNRNKHSEEQIERLCELIKYQGFRVPLIVDVDTNEIVAGHGRLEAAKKMGLESVPVIFEKFDSYDQKYAFMISDNSIQSWSELDLSSIHDDLGDLELPSIDLLGIENFEFEPGPDINDFKNNEEKKMKFYTCPNCEAEFEEKQAVLRVE